MPPLVSRFIDVFLLKENKKASGTAKKSPGKRKATSTKTSAKKPAKKPKKEESEDDESEEDSAEFDEDVEEDEEEESLDAVSFQNLTLIMIVQFINHNVFVIE